MSFSPPPKIGIVSGIGPLAGSDILARVFKNAALVHGAVEDSEYPDLLLLNHGIVGVDNTATLTDSFEQEVIKMVKDLEAQGANIIGIACNTAHAYLPNIKAKPGTIIVNLIKEVSLEASKVQDNYLLLTSSSSKHTKLYNGYLEKQNVSFRETNASHQKLLDRTIGLVMAHKLHEAAELVGGVLRQAKRDGFSAVIAGCTELPVAIAHCKIVPEINITDSNEVLAKTLAKLYYANLKTGHI